MLLLQSGALLSPHRIHALHASDAWADLSDSTSRLRVGSIRYKQFADYDLRACQRKPLWSGLEATTARYDGRDVLRISGPINWLWRCRQRPWHPKPLRLPRPWRVPWQVLLPFGWGMRNDCSEVSLWTCLRRVTSICAIRAKNICRNIKKVYNFLVIKIHFSQ